MGHATICRSGSKTMETDATSMKLLIDSSIVSTIKSSLCFASAIALTYISQTDIQFVSRIPSRFLTRERFLWTKKTLINLSPLAVDPKYRGIWHTYISLLAD
jgi:hypothetical protein